MSTITRFFSLLTKTSPLAISYFFQKNNPQSKEFLKTTVRIRETFQKLGPTYIKLGQMISSRPDIVGPELSSELRNLLDNEPALPFSQIKNALEQELHQPLEKIFSSFDEDALASASIAQVHKGKLHTNKLVAVKVQRPGIEEIIKKDLQVLHMCSRLLGFLFVKSKIQPAYIYKEFADWIQNELDFQVEGRRADKFRENMKSLEGITIPTIYWKYGSKKILTMEFLEGPTLNTLLNEMKDQHVPSLYTLKTKEKINPDILIKRILAAIAKQTLKDRYFHGDLHPANIIIQPHTVVSFVDFGIIGTLDNKEYMELVFVMLSLVEDDPESLSKAVLALVTQALTERETAEIKQVVSDELHLLHEDSSGKVSMNHFITTMLSLAHRYNMFWSPGTLLAMKTIGQIDFVAGQIGLKEPLVDLMKPEVEKYITSAISSQISKETLFKTLLNLLETGKKLPETINEVEQLVNSGQLVKVESEFTKPQFNFLDNFVLPVSGTFLLSFPILTSTFVSNSSMKTFLFIAVPLLLFAILAKIFEKRREVK